MQKLNVYPLIYGQKYWKKVQEKIINIKDKKCSVQQLIQYLIYFNELTMNPKGKIKIDFNLLLLIANKEKILNIFSLIGNVILTNEQKYRICKIPLFKKKQKKSQNLSINDLILLLCLMSMCLTLPVQGYFNKYKNFSFIFTQQKTKTITILKYLSNIFNTKKIQLQNIVTINRSHLTQSIHFFHLKNQTRKMTQLNYLSNQSSIQQKIGTIKVDFANKYIGGGSLLFGKVQQQIMFINRPQLYVTMLLCQQMDSNQAISLVGFRKYFKNKGYGENVMFDCDQDIKYEKDKQNRIKQYILAIDALKDPPAQFQHESILRQLNKSIVGFGMIEQVDTITTGNWGCGAFKGDPQLKFMIQWLSASYVGKKLNYCPYGNKQLAKAEQIINLLKNRSIGQVAQILQKLKDNGGNSVFGYIRKSIKEEI